MKDNNYFCVVINTTVYIEKIGRKFPKNIIRKCAFMELIISWIVLSVAIFVTAYILPGVTIASWMTAFVAALVLGLVNTLLKPILIFLTLSINIITLGLFTVVINALLVLLVAMIVPNFSVRNFWWAVAFSVVVAIINVILLGFFDLIF